MDDTVLQIRNLRVRFKGENGLVPAVDGVSLSVRRGQVYGLVGESGCGKSTLAMAVPRLLPIPPAEITAGEIHFAGRNLLACSPEEMRTLRGRKIGVIFQDPMTSLSPLWKIGRQLEELFLLHTDWPASRRREEALAWFRKVRLDDAERVAACYPHELSGGMQQRVMIAMALALQPDLVIADEPTTALDVTVQKQILDLLKTLCAGSTAVLLITHDMGVVYEMADTVGVMYAGELVEEAPASEFFRRPLHPYSQMLLKALPSATTRGRPLFTIPGNVPDTSTWKTEACRFAERCEFYVDGTCPAGKQTWREDAGRGFRCRRVKTAGQGKAS